MSYPGNATLTREMQERILSTFEQTLTAAAAGNRQEATLGCDFILRLDSLFGPARELLDRMQTGEGPVSVDDLAAAIGKAPAGQPAAAVKETPAPVTPPPAEPPAAAQPPLPDIDDLSDLDLEMGLSDPAAEAAAPATPAAPLVPPEPTPEPPAATAPPATPAEPPPAASPANETSGVEEMDDLDFDLGLGMDEEPRSPTPPAAAEPFAFDGAEPTPPPPFEGLGASAPAPVEAPAPEPAPTPIPPPAAEPVAEAAEPQPAATPATETAPDALRLPELDDLDDLDLSAAAEAPADAGATGDEPKPVAEPTAEEATKESPEAAVEEPATEAKPAAPAPAPESVEIPLGTEPAAQLDTESQQRIDDLLAEGQQAFDGGEYQGAIDAWSRIFLIDIDHAQANKQIEEARKLKAEADRKVEEKFHEGLAHLEGGESDAAAESFRAVLAMQSSHLAARDYLEKLEAGEVPVPTELTRPLDAEPGGAVAEAPDPDLDGDLDEEAKVKPDRGTKAVGERMVSIKKSPFKSKSFMAIAAAGLIAVLGGAWYLFNNWDSLFPNSAQETPAESAPDPLARAKKLHDEGKAPIAIAQLRRLPPDSPQYGEAQALIAQWELEQAPTESGSQGPSPQELARREALLAEAGAAAERREFMRTSELLSAAAVIEPLSGAEVQLLARADEQLQELQNFITIFREGEWDLALRDLWLLHESDPGNRDVTRLLVDSYYNLGLRALQRKDVKAASERFKEALSLTPDDPELLRLDRFATIYQARTNDLLYRIYVKYHPFR